MLLARGNLDPLDSACGPDLQPHFGTELGAVLSLTTSGGSHARPLCVSSAGVMLFPVRVAGGDSAI